ncbi:MAG: hypothetical protein QXW10_04645, partial [Candidatus Micrarchaeaceae archaeon]
MVAYVASTADQLAGLKILNANSGKSFRILSEWALPKNEELLRAVVKPRIFTFPNPRNVLMSGALFLPLSVVHATKAQGDEGATTKRRIPLMMYVYGGPHAQLVHSNLLEMSFNVIVQTLVHFNVA